MTTGRFYRLVVIGSIALAILLAGAMLSCDKRSAVGSGDDGGTRYGIGNILVTLNPSQIRLSSPDATDSVTVGIAVIDSQGVGVQGARVTVTRNPSLGFLTQPDTTDAQGRTTALFIAQPGQYDSTRISVTAGGISRSALLVITGPSSFNLNLTYSPPIPKLIDHEGDPYTITATLVDTTQRGVYNQPVTFAVINQVGRIGFSDPNITIPRTDSRGIVEALFYNTQIDEINLPTSAEIQAITQAPDGNIMAASVSVPLRRVQNVLTIESTPTEVIGDGSSSTTIRAFLLDTDGHGIVGDTIYFSDLTQMGSIQARRVTDDNGIATSTYVPFGGVNEADTARILAEYRPGSIVHQATANTNVTIQPVRSIGFITVSLQKTSVVANGVDSSAIFITVQDSSGSLIADGTPIYLSHTGTGFLSAPQLSTVDGQARAKITAPANIVNPPRVDSIFVRGQLNDSVSVADTAVVTYVPGTINQIAFVYPETTIAMIAGSGDTCSVIAYCVDANGNPVANGTQITFRNTILTSSLTPVAAPTNDGFARAIYLVGSGTGADNITALIPNPTNPNDTIRTLHPVVINCLSSDATTLQLATTQSNIQVGGASTQIIATLQDAYGNPLSEGYYVAFDITVAPGNRFSPGERPSFDTQFLVEHDTVATNINGQAIVQLYSGTKSGAVSIRACTIPLPPDSLYVCNEKALVTISSGPPNFITITFSYTGEAVNPNTPERFVQVGAIVGDRYANPVEYGTAVYFSLVPNDMADIEGNSYTGGSRPYHPDSTDGVAYTRIIYGCFSTFDSVKIIAASAGDSAEVVDTSGVFFLPIFGGAINMTAVPGNLWTDNDQCNCSGGPNNNCRDTTLITAVLTDDGGCPIEGGGVVFSAINAGFIIEPSVDTTDSNGRATCRFYIRGCDIPLLPDGTQAMIEVAVRAVLQQKPEVNSEINIVCRRPVN